MTPTAQATKAKNKQVHQTKKALFSKETINNRKRQPIDWRKYLSAIYLIRGEYPKYISNSYHSVTYKKIWLKARPKA
jgi:hypothetical protein